MTKHRDFLATINRPRQLENQMFGFLLLFALGLGAGAQVLVGMAFDDFSPWWSVPGWLCMALALLGRWIVKREMRR